LTSAKFQFLGKGVYSLSEAERLTRIPRRRIRRWIEGYSFVSSGKRHRSPPVVLSDIGRNVGELALTFSDLIEIRFLDAFIQHGVSWRAVRIATERARELLSRQHPFSTKQFKTDGKDILAEIARHGKDRELLNLVKNQWELERVVNPMLFAGIEFNQFDEPERWWPMTKARLVVIDPARSFGAPIVSDGGVRTAILAASAAAEKSQKTTAQLYDVPLRAVRDAVYYETQFLG
jgi:uncharacterized protein (DUF433 family)